MRPALRQWLRAAWLLAAIVVAASATLRLAANGIGCAPWPSCYGQSATAAAANEQPALKALRVAASAFALAAVVIVVLGWRAWPAPQRAAGAALLVVTGILSWVGLFTPSPLPAVTLANVLGGFALLALLAFLLAADSPAGVDRDGGRPAWPLVLLAALALQALGGALISARLAGAACTPDCGLVWLPGGAQLMHPFAVGAADELLPRGGEPLQMLHSFGGLALMLACAITAVVLRERVRPWARALLVVALATGTLGFVVAAAEPALAAAVLHALAAGVLGALLAVWWPAARRSMEKST